MKRQNKDGSVYQGGPKDEIVPVYLALDCIFLFKHVQITSRIDLPPYPRPERDAIIFPKETKCQLPQQSVTQGIDLPTYPEKLQKVRDARRNLDMFPNCSQIFKPWRTNVAVTKIHCQIIMCLHPIDLLLLNM